MSLGVVSDHCRFAFVVLCGYSSFSFQSCYVLHHLVIVPVHNTKKLPIPGTLLLGEGGGVLPYRGYIGMCCYEGCGFQSVYSGMGYINQRVWV